MLSLLHHQVCVSGFFKTKNVVRLSGQPTLGKAWPNFSFQIGGYSGLEPIAAAAQGRAGIYQPFEHDGHEVDLHF